MLKLCYCFDTVILYAVSIVEIFSQCVCYHVFGIVDFHPFCSATRYLYRICFQMRWLPSKQHLLLLLAVAFAVIHTRIALCEGNFPQSGEILSIHSRWKARLFPSAACLTRCVEKLIFQFYSASKAHVLTNVLSVDGWWLHRTVTKFTTWTLNNPYRNSVRYQRGNWTFSSRMVSLSFWCRYS